jgi:hypothetical protein
MKAVQKRVADTLLENAQAVMLGGKRYKVAPPTIGTLVMVSEKIAELPDFDTGTQNVLGSVVSNAKDAAAISEVCAILILGAKRIKGFCGAWRLRRLSRKILLNASPKDVLREIKAVIYGMNLSDFFSLTTFLQGINVTEPTKVETEATVSGQ